MTDARKADTRAKIQLGGLVIKAGLSQFDPATLLGAFLHFRQAFDDPDRIEEFRRVGREALNPNTGGPRPSIRIRFPNRPPAEVRAFLLSRKIRFGDEVWEGEGNKDEIRPIIEPHGGEFV